MTTPPTPAGWYPAPDGSGGQRYWDGSAWTEHHSPGAHAAPEPSESPAAEPPVSEQPTAVVHTGAADGSGGAHRAPEPDAESEPTASASTPPSAETTAPVYAGATAAPEPSPAAEQPRSDGNRGLIIKFGAACAALLAVLVVVLIYAFVIHKDNKVQIGASGDTTTSKSASPTTSATKTKTQTQTESPTAAPGSGQATDSGITFAVNSVETAPSVKYQDAPVEKTAQGEFVIVHMTVLNSGDAPTTFLGTLQKLKAGGTTYSIDDEATFYLNGGLAELNPGDSADVGLAFDVPPGTVPETLEVHGDAVSPGIDLPLS
ncbi:DUF4352 domain-containing protein [Mycobacterium sp. MMS18-G62]